MVESAREPLRIERVDAAHVRLGGALGFAEAAVAWGRVGDVVGNGEGTLELDVAGLQRSDSATLAVLLAWAAQAAQRGCHLRLRGVSDDLRALAHLCEVEPLLGLT